MKFQVPNFFATRILVTAYVACITVLKDKTRVLSKPLQIFLSFQVEQQCSGFSHAFLMSLLKKTGLDKEIDIAETYLRLAADSPIGEARFLVLLCYLCRKGCVFMRYQISRFQA